MKMMREPYIKHDWMTQKHFWFFADSWGSHIGWDLPWILSWLLPTIDIQMKLMGPNQAQSLPMDLCLTHPKCIKTWLNDTKALLIFGRLMREPYWLRFDMDFVITFAHHWHPNDSDGTKPDQISLQSLPMDLLCLTHQKCIKTWLNDTKALLIFCRLMKEPYWLRFALEFVITFAHHWHPNEAVGTKPGPIIANGLMFDSSKKHKNMIEWHKSTSEF